MNLHTSRALAKGTDAATVCFALRGGMAAMSGVEKSLKRSVAALAVGCVQTKALQSPVTIARNFPFS